MDELVSTIIGLEKEDIVLNSKLENMTKFVHLLNSGSDMLDNILEIWEKNVIGLEYNSMNKREQKS